MGETAGGGGLGQCTLLVVHALDEKTFCSQNCELFGKLTLLAVSSCCDCHSTADRKSARYRGHPVGTSAATRHQQVSAGRTPPAGSVGSEPSGIVPGLKGREEKKRRLLKNIEF